MFAKNYANRIEDNKGFTLVEVLIAVVILAAVTGPILKSFTTSAWVNSKAQRIQNATSLAESVMEEVKGNSIEGLYKMSQTRSEMNFLVYAPDSTLVQGEISESHTDEPPYIITYTDVTATQGDKYDAKVTISREEYAKATGDVTDISDANSTALPKLSKVNSEEHAVLSWEINEYDDSAMDRLAEENSKQGSEFASFVNSTKTNGKKETIITIDPEGTDNTKISCNVEYSTGNSSDKSIRLLVYTGYFNNAGITPNIYLFYSVSEKCPNVPTGQYFKNETITVKDNTSSKGHNVYLILQDNMNKLSTSGGTKVNVNISGTGYDTPVNLLSTTNIIASTFPLSNGADNVAGTADDVKFYTNLLNNANEDGILYDTVIKDRIYYVTTEVYKHGDSTVLAKLNSTINAGKEADR